MGRVIENCFLIQTLVYSRGISCDFQERLTCFAPSANSFFFSLSFFSFCDSPFFFVTKGFQNNFQELRKPRDFCDSCTSSRCLTLPWRRSTSILLRGLLREVLFSAHGYPFCVYVGDLESSKMKPCDGHMPFCSHLCFNDISEIHMNLYIFKKREK